MLYDIWLTSVILTSHHEEMKEHVALETFFRKICKQIGHFHKHVVW
jgi:hypothetical protein